jgi:hypothetical protein
MSNRLNAILEEIRDLENEVQEEIKRKQEDLRYTLKKGKVYFDEEVRQLHKKYSLSVFRYILGARIAILLTAPIIYLMIVPAGLMDLGISFYQVICFPVYGIPRVRRRDHFFIDAQYLKYLNAIERLNCVYCGYFNGLTSYIGEIGARTEQYWCPIKHASGKAKRHSRYHLFVDYGDAEAYKSRLQDIRNKYDDVG